MSLNFDEVPEKSIERGQIFPSLDFILYDFLLNF